MSGSAVAQKAILHAQRRPTHKSQGSFALSQQPIGNTQSQPTAVNQPIKCKTFENLSESTKTSKLSATKRPFPNRRRRSFAPFNHITMSVSLLICVLQTVIYGSTLADHEREKLVRCYSCMSKFYERHWWALQKIYRDPKNFSDSCNSDGRLYDIQMVTCPSVCVKMYEKGQVGGMYVDGYIRGCYDTLLQKGFNKTIVVRYNWLSKDSCGIYSRRHVMQLKENTHPDDPMSVCTCYGDRCNGYSTNSGAHTRGIRRSRGCAQLRIFDGWPSVSTIVLLIGAQLVYTWT